MSSTSNLSKWGTSKSTLIALEHFEVLGKGNTGCQVEASLDLVQCLVVEATGGNPKDMSRVMCLFAWAGRGEETRQKIVVWERVTVFADISDLQAEEAKPPT